MNPANEFISMPIVSEIQINNTSYFAEVHDIGVPLEETPVYPGDPQYSRIWLSRLEDGANYDLSALILGSHAGAHLDAPAHQLLGGRTIDQYPLSRFILPAQVISVNCKGAGDPIPASALHDLKINKGEALLFKTNNSLRRLMHNSVFTEEFVHLSEEAAACCVSMGISLVGIDYLSVDRYGDDLAPAHHCLLENDILILEGIDLQAVSPGKYQLICLPVNATNAEAAPVRPVLVG
jgi:arylformamidase